MARVTVLPNGVTASCPREGPMKEKPPKRGAVQGWSRGSVGRLRRWFYSVDGDQLDGRGFALTLTVRETPPAAADWTRTREAFKKRMVRAGAVRFQWLTEWQRRGVPHLHGCVFFPEASEVTPSVLQEHWLSSAQEWGAGRSAQVVTPLWGLSGWLQYQAKHSARGVRHYQRANVPEAWRGATGRLWGVTGHWPVREEVQAVDMETFHRFRRLLRSWMVAQARKEAKKPEHWRRVAYLRRMLMDPERERSYVRAVGEFCPEEVSRELLLAASWGELGTSGDASSVEGPPKPSERSCSWSRSRSEASA